jgi:hypothetical protein
VVLLNSNGSGDVVMDLGLAVFTTSV